MFGNEKLTPELLMTLGAGIGSGTNLTQGISNGLLGATSVLDAQKAKSADMATRNATVTMLQQKDPELAAMVASGALPVKDAYVMYIKKQQDAAAAAKPQYQVINGKLIQTNSPDGIKVAGDFSDPNANIPADAKDFNYQQTHPEYKAYKDTTTAAKDAPASVQEYIWAKNNQDFQGTLEDYQKNKISLKNQKGTEGNLKGDLETMKAYRGEDPVKAYQVVHASYQKARSAAQLGTAAGDMSLIYAFMKMNDPTSVVREGEFATAANAGGVDDKIINIYNRVRDGQMLTPDQRAQFLQAADAQYQDVSKNVNDVNTRYTPFAKDYNVNTDRFMIQPEQFKPLSVGDTHETTDKNGNPVVIQRLK